jgi:hypothetical protein
VKSELIKAGAMSLGTCAFIVSLAYRGDLPKPLVVVFIIAFAIILPAAVFAARAGRFR